MVSGGGLSVSVSVELYGGTSLPGIPSCRTLKADKLGRLK